MDKTIEQKSSRSSKKLAIVISVILAFAVLTAVLSILALNLLPARSVSILDIGGDINASFVNIDQEKNLFVQTTRNGIPIEPHTYWIITPGPEHTEESPQWNVTQYTGEHDFEFDAPAVDPCRDCDGRYHESFWSWMGCYFERHWQSPMWRLSQVFALFAWIFSVWSWQMKDKVKCLFLVGMFSWLLVVSAALLGNWTLAILFGLAAVRNFVFCYFDWRGRRGREVARKWYVVFAWIFAISTFGSTILLLHVFPALDIMHVPTYAIWLEWLICITLLGLIVGNILQGTALMRWSFIFNRVFNIVNHAYFANVIAVFIAVAAILSNLLFFARMAIEKAKGEQEELSAESDEPEATQST